MDKKLKRKIGQMKMSEEKRKALQSIRELKYSSQNRLQQVINVRKNKN